MEGTGGYPTFSGSFDARLFFTSEDPLLFDALFHVFYTRSNPDRRLVIRGWSIRCGGLDIDQGPALASSFRVTLSWSRAGLVDVADFLDMVNSTNGVQFQTTSVADPITGWNLPGFSKFDGVVKAPDSLVDEIAARVEFSGPIPVNTFQWTAAVNVWGQEV